MLITEQLKIIEKNHCTKKDAVIFSLITNASVLN
jgi:hypothetical protein